MGELFKVIVDISTVSRSYISNSLIRRMDAIFFRLDDEVWTPTTPFFCGIPFERETAPEPPSLTTAK